MKAYTHAARAYVWCYDLWNGSASYPAGRAASWTEVQVFLALFDAHFVSFYLFGCFFGLWGIHTFVHFLGCWSARFTEGIMEIEVMREHSRKTSVPSVISTVQFPSSQSGWGGGLRWSGIVFWLIRKKGARLSCVFLSSLMHNVTFFVCNDLFNMQVTAQIFLFKTHDGLWRSGCPMKTCPICRNRNCKWFRNLNEIFILCHNLFFGITPVSQTPNLLLSQLKIQTFSLHCTNLFISLYLSH